MNALLVANRICRPIGVRRMSTLNPVLMDKTKKTLGVALGLATVGGIAWAFVARSNKKRVDAWYKKYDATSPNEE